MSGFFCFLAFGFFVVFGFCLFAWGCFWGVVFVSGVFCLFFFLPQAFLAP